MRAGDGRKEPAVRVADECNREGLRQGSSPPVPPGPIAIPEPVPGVGLIRAVDKDADPEQPGRFGFAPYAASLRLDRCVRLEQLRHSCARLPVRPGTGIYLR